MANITTFQNKINAIVMVVLLVVIATVVVFWNHGRESNTAVIVSSKGQAQLVSIQQLPEMEMDGEMCQAVPASASVHQSLLAAFEEESAKGALASSDAARAAVATRKPLREIRDPYSAYSAVAVDQVHNEVVMVDENLYSILAYDRLENTPPKASLSEPKRMIQGPSTQLEFPCSVYVDSATGDIYTVNNDTHRKLNIFPYAARGNAAPLRSINTPMSAFGLTVDQRNQEILLSIQDAHAVVTYSKSAKDNDKPIRTLQGEHTGLGDPHGMALDPSTDLIYVTNWGPNGPPDGSGDTTNIPGKFLPPSITVYPRTASGDTPPLRVIQGPKTQFNWPTGLAIDSNRGELFVVNDPTSSVVVFKAEASGDVAPIRVLQGPKTLLKNPTGVYVDSKNDELWVANYGNHSATVYKLNASGNTPPQRVIRSGPLNAPAPMMSNPHAVAYDSKREEILVAT